MFDQSILNKKIVVFGVGVYGEDFCRRMQLLGYKNICCFCDNNPMKQGQIKFGLPVYSPKKSTILFPTAVFVITLFNHTEAARKQLLSLGVTEDRITSFGKDDMINERDAEICTAKKEEYRNWCEKYTKQVSRLKGKYLGKRCFIVGNGGSLTIDDLELLQNEYTFGANRIYMLYDKTLWRPTFYCVYDMLRIRLIRNALEDITNESQYIFTTAEFKDDLPEHIFENPKWMFINNVKDRFFPNPPAFSEDVSDITYDGQTVTFFATQIAIYLGFKEIYFLGMDNHYSAELKQDGTVHYDKKMKDYPDGMGDIDLTQSVIPQIELTTLSFEATKKYARAHDIKVINATRGGRLDLFERKSLEEILGNG